MSTHALIIFAKQPIPGQVKTRLGKTMGMEKAAQIYETLLIHTLRVAAQCAGVTLYLYKTRESDARYFETITSIPLVIRDQINGDLGQRMVTALGDVLEKDADKALIIGTDCPGINAACLYDAFNRLDTHELVIGPTKDGGYYLLGMKQPHDFLFENMLWSTAAVFAETIKRITARNLDVFTLDTLVDVDEEKDWVD